MFCLGKLQKKEWGEKSWKEGEGGKEGRKDEGKKGRGEEGGGMMKVGGSERRGRKE